MKKILITITGRTGSGKSTLAKQLSQLFGINYVKSYTTRKPRDSEVEESDHIFIDYDKFDAMSKRGELIAETTINGNRYGITKEMLDDANIYVIDTYGLNEFYAKCGDEYHIIPLYMDIPMEICRNRFIYRGLMASDADGKDIREKFEKRWRNEEENTCQVWLGGKFYPITQYEGCYDVMEAIHIIARHLKDHGFRTNQKVFFDFDGVIGDTIKTVVDLYHQDYCNVDGYTPVRYDDVKTWHFQELNLLTQNKLYDYFDSQRFFNKLRYTDECILPRVWMILLESLGFRNHIVTLGTKRNLELKMNYLTKNHYPCDFIGLETNKHLDKSSVDMTEGVFVDDKVNNMLTSNAKDKIVFGKVYPWNQHYFNMKRINTWGNLFWYLITHYIEI